MLLLSSYLLVAHIKAISERYVMKRVQVTPVLFLQINGERVVANTSPVSQKQKTITRESCTTMQRLGDSSIQERDESAKVQVL